MKRLLSITVTVVGLTLLIQVVAPLYVFLNGLEDGVSISVYSESDGSLVVELSYDIDVDLANARLAVTASGKTYEAWDDNLTRGETLRVTINSGAESIESITLEGMVGGLYYVSVTLRQG